MGSEMCIRDSAGPDHFGQPVHVDRVDVQPLLDLGAHLVGPRLGACLLYTSDAADERSSVDLGGRRIIKKKNLCSRTNIVSNLLTR